MIISQRDLDAQMGKTVDPSSIPKHDGGSQGAMQAMIPNQSDHVEVQQGHGQRGSAIYDVNEIPQKGFYGSSTIISVNDAPPLDAKMEPKAIPVPGMPEPITKVPASQAPKPFVMPPLTKAPVAVPVQAPQAAARPKTAVELLAQMGLQPPKPTQKS